MACFGGEHWRADEERPQAYEFLRAVACIAITGRRVALPEEFGADTGVLIRRLCADAIHPIVIDRLPLAAARAITRVGARGLDGRIMLLPCDASWCPDRLPVATRRCPPGVARPVLPGRTSRVAHVCNRIAPIHVIPVGCGDWWRSGPLVQKIESSEPPPPGSPPPGSLQLPLSPPDVSG